MQNIPRLYFFPGLYRTHAKTWIQWVTRFNAGKLQRLYTHINEPTWTVYFFMYKNSNKQCKILPNEETQNVTWRYFLSLSLCPLHTPTNTHAFTSYIPIPSEASPNSHSGWQAGRSVISGVLGVDWTRLMGDICPSCLSIRVSRI